MNISKKSPVFIGLGKTIFTSSVCVIDPLSKDGPTTHLLERYSRKKADGGWPAAILEEIKNKYSDREFIITENRDVQCPHFYEKGLNKAFPLFEFISSKGLEQFSSHFNSDLRFLTHHYCHALVAKYMSPFKKAAVLVIDGAGSNSSDFSSDHLDFKLLKNIDKDLHEECSLYSFDEGELTPVWKKWQKFEPSKKFPNHSYSEGLGTCYEKVAEFIFSSKRASGKVMGLAAFGKSLNFSSSRELLESLDWNRSFKGNTKEEWEADLEMEYFKDLAASIQDLYETRLSQLADEVKSSLNEYENLIIVGGSALNCTNNMKLIISDKFKEIYVPPFPGDESIGLGCALHSYYNKNEWKCLKHEDQSGYLGLDYAYSKEDILEVFSEYELITSENIIDLTSDLIVQGEIIGWFQGRSESGPRALGNRSILSRMDIKGRKDYLNSSVKFRESFRPYGSSVTYEKTFEYFDIPKTFNNPYMSFAVHVNDNYKDLFSEATHVDGTSRMQSVREGQNPKFYNLIQKVGEKSGVYGVLNTSLNTMGEPIVETIIDLKKFLDVSNVYGVVIDNILIKKKQS
jgi:carbamoyltransferase